MKHIKEIMNDIVNDTNINYEFRQALNLKPDSCTDCDKQAVVLNNGIPYCVKCYNKIKEIRK
tara:strand:- start:57 stop:242 length:186 start_codon:yes stop_codon:yes gene_type:complete